MEVAYAESTCLHQQTARLNGQTYCTECGEEIMSFCKDETRFFDDATVALANDRKAPKSIRKELDLLPLSDEIKERADKIYAYKAGTNTYRAKVRQEVKFSCIMDAFNEAKIYKDPREIAAMLGIKRKGMSRGVKRCSFLCTGKESAVRTSITAIHLVPEMLSRCGIEYDQTHLDDLERIYTYTKERSVLFSRSNPQSIASALIYFYLRKKDKDRKVSKADVAKNLGVSMMTITKIDNELESICGDILTGDN